MKTHLLYKAYRAACVEALKACTLLAKTLKVERNLLLKGLPDVHTWEDPSFCIPIPYGDAGQNWYLKIPGPVGRSHREVFSPISPWWTLLDCGQETVYVFETKEVRDIINFLLSNREGLWLKGLRIRVPNCDGSGARLDKEKAFSDFRRKYWEVRYQLPVRIYDQMASELAQVRDKVQKAYPKAKFDSSEGREEFQIGPQSFCVSYPSEWFCEPLSTEDPNPRWIFQSSPRRGSSEKAVRKELPLSLALGKVRSTLFEFIEETLVRSCLKEF